MRLHPIQLTYKRTKNEQKCELCGTVETWSSSVATYAQNLSEVARWNTMHLVHLVKDHLPDVQASVGTAGAREQLDISEPDIRKRVARG